MGLKMNLRIIMKNRAGDPVVGFLTKPILKPYCRAAAMPTAWELKTDQRSTKVESTKMRNLAFFILSQINEKISYSELFARLNLSSFEHSCLSPSYLFTL